MTDRRITLPDAPRRRTNGPLRLGGQNPCYFSDRDGDPVYLTGSHTWSSFQECFSGDLDEAFDFPAYVDWLVRHNHNFIRGWHWEQTSWDQFTTERVPIRPLPFPRTGPGSAKDGLPTFDCARIDEGYLRRLRERVALAGDHGIYVSVMLFQGWSSDIRRAGIPVGNPWDGHPFNRENNVNGLDGDPGLTGFGRAVHTLAVPSVTRTQESYVRAVVEHLNDLDNVLYEIGNEHYEESYEWEEHMVRFIHEVEATLPYRHPVGMTSGGGGDDSVTNAQLLASSAEFIAPRERNEPHAPYINDPPVPSGRQVVFSDTDHLWGLGGSVEWVWKSFTRGLNVLLMDPYEPMHGMDDDRWGAWCPLNRRDHPLFEPIRLSMGYSRVFAGRLDLGAVRPMPDLASSRFCLANPGTEYLVYLGDEAEVTMVIDKPGRELRVEWFDPQTASFADGAPVRGANPTLSSPFGPGSVLFLHT